MSNNVIPLRPKPDDKTLPEIIITVSELIKAYHATMSAAAMLCHADVQALDGVQGKVMNLSVETHLVLTDLKETYVRLYGKADFCALWLTALDEAGLKNSSALRAWADMPPDAKG